ncbi:hypothetical protein [Marinobacter nauticus]|uniref:hypothetical protein n=1 Tax=Marinobacter nauticus TaxID=2743 RepID=UPI001C943395|nr:hypothetical protein [Marinobacter nauticus]MBY6102429.1 hypothetical protein [Marinobacter nauticus]
MDSQPKSRSEYQSAITGVMEELWNQQLHKPDVYRKYKDQFDSYEAFPAVYKGVAAVLGLASLGLGLAFHWFIGAVGLIGVLFFVLRTRGNAKQAQQQLGDLVQPSQIFPGVASNKIEMEARVRSQDAGHYIRAVNAGGRYGLSGFEVQRIARILSYLDRLEQLEAEKN